MKTSGTTSGTGLEQHGITDAGTIHWNAPAPVLYEQIIGRGEAVLAHLGPVAVNTGRHTGRSPHDKFIVDEPESHDNIWWGRVNHPLSPARFDAIHRRLLHFLRGRDLFVQDCFAGARLQQRLPVRVITETAWHSLFARNMFIRATQEEPQFREPEFTVLAVPGFSADPSLDGTNSSVFIIINLNKKLVLIGGTAYAGEIKKSVFTVMNYLLPEKGILPMHCSANKVTAGKTAIFFGLSGTGKTALSADPDRQLIGDDEHGWDDRGIFNFEGGCYAKLIRLSRELEPEIYECTRRFGTILENVYIDSSSRRIDLDSDVFTENTRASYPLAAISGAVPSGTGGHPEHVIMLTCDAFGVLPPVSRLSVDQAVYHFLSGYTAKIAGTERGAGNEPQAIFSPCFAEPFLPRHPVVYGKMFREKILEHRPGCWLVNTGWLGGGYGAGRRIDIRYSRAMVKAVVDGALDSAPFETDPFFGLSIPKSCPGVPAEILSPRKTWQDKTAYDHAAQSLKASFRNNFRQFADEVDKEVARVL